MLGKTAAQIKGSSRSCLPFGVAGCRITQGFLLATLPRTFSSYGRTTSRATSIQATRVIYAASKNLSFLLEKGSGIKGIGFATESPQRSVSSWCSRARVLTMCSCWAPNWATTRTTHHTTPRRGGNSPPRSEFPWSAACMTSATSPSGLDCFLRLEQKGFCSIRILCVVIRLQVGRSQTSVPAFMRYLNTKPLVEPVSSRYRTTSRIEI